MIHVYTGNGKGKTTAALGLAIRAAGAGLKVYIAQFAKGRNYCELRSLKKFPNIRCEQFGTACFIRKKPGKKDIALAKDGIKKLEKILKSDTYRLVIMDEANIALHLGLITLSQLKQLCKVALKNKEIVITGRYAAPEIIRLADLVSEVKEIKHYYRRGIKARRGIEF